MGKSGLVINIADHVAREKEKAVALFSLEMSEMEIAQRMIASRARIPSDKLRKGQFAKSDWQRVVRRRQRARAGAALDRRLLGPRHARPAGEGPPPARSEAAGDGDGLGLIIVDYLQLMRADDTRANRVEQVGQMSRGLKILARELEVPVIALSQLSRAPEQRTGGTSGRSSRTSASRGTSSRTPTSSPSSTARSTTRTSPRTRASPS